MSLRDILVYMDDTPSAGVRLDAAIGLAQVHGAQVAGLFVRTPSQVPHWMVAPLGPDVVEVHAEFIRRAEVRAEAVFRTRIESAGLEADWHSVEGDRDEMLVRIGRSTDLVVMGRAPSGKKIDLEKRFIANVVLALGRPVLVIAAPAPTLVGRNILVAWDGSREASRALNDAIALLRKADTVTVMTVGESDGGCLNEETPAVCRHLKLHGVRATTWEADEDDGVKGKLLLAKASEIGADLIVCGAYGRSSLKDLVLGGTTRYLLRHAPISLLMSH
ncbi:MAG: hypothetical protein A2516_05180 [Alphaproteobacteria bacterium RIFOXYD12_FULL_60_8]|nr:MAG: hypothetical protein A2516_05180 [Alphaproteobacteria bacterium RIFOXYD12_FULL_60_8]